MFNRGKRARQASTSNPDAIQFRDEAQRKAYEKILGYHHVPTKFPDLTALQSFRIERGVEELFENLGWPKLLQMEPFAYHPRFTSEFLSSCYIERNPAILHFRHRNQDMTIPLRRLTTLAHEPADHYTVEDCPNPLPNAHQLWHIITDETHFSARNSKAANIIYPTLRVAHRVLACLLYPRKETGSVSAKELFLLMKMIYNEPAKPHFGYFLAHSLVGFRESQQKECHYGGIVAAILNLVRADTSGPQLTLSNRLTTDAFKTFRFVNAINGGEGWVWLQPGNRPNIAVRDDFMPYDRPFNLERPTQDTNWKPNVVTFQVPLHEQPPTYEELPQQYDEQYDQQHHEQHQDEEMGEEPDHWRQQVDARLSSIEQNYQHFYTQFGTFIADHNTRYTNLYTRVDNLTGQFEQMQISVQDMSNMIRAMYHSQFPPPPPPGLQ